jgi:ABC-type uncharacterized transport system involved in gliding motility auxiliary subunit
MPENEPEKERMSLTHSLKGRRQLVRTGVLSAAVLLVAALFLIFNYLGWKYHHRFDWTAGGVYSLSDKSRKVVQELKRDVEFVVFIEPGRDLYEPVHEILSQYDAASQRITVRYIDPERKPVEAQQLVQKYNVSSAGVVVASGADKRVIDSADLAEFDYSGMQMGEAPKMTGFKGEQLFTSALLQLAEGRKPKVLFTTGHGEHSLDDRQEHGLANIHDLLGRDNFELEEWASRTAGAVPQGTDLVVVAGPTSPFIEPELKAFGTYLSGGGRMLVLVDPTPGQTPGSGLVPTGLNQWLAGYGVKLGDDIVLDPKGSYPGAPPYTLYSAIYEGDHPITQPLAQANVPVLLNVARSVSAQPAGSYKVTELVKTTEEGWGETSLSTMEHVQKDAQDLAGPISLGVAVETPVEEGKKPLRLVVLGDSDLATNQFVAGMPANAVLLANSLNWLAEREALLTIPPKKTESVRLNLSASQYRNIVLMAVLFLPSVAAALGIAVYVRRRR